MSTLTETLRMLFNKTKTKKQNKNDDHQTKSFIAQKHLNTKGNTIATNLQDSLVRSSLKFCRASSALNVYARSEIRSFSNTLYVLPMYWFWIFLKEYRWSWRENSVVILRSTATRDDSMKTAFMFCTTSAICSERSLTSTCSEKTKIEWPQTKDIDCFCHKQESTANDLVVSKQAINSNFDLYLI